MPAFGEFYRAVNGRDPFPWQSRLADRVAETERWPAEVGVPTGLGKTACLDIAVWWLASQADRSPDARTAPTRIWWLVNRRLLVDATTEHAEAVSSELTDPRTCGLGGPEADAVVAVADRLRSLSADPAASPLEVIRLRGGVPSRMPTDPSQPSILLSTLPMYGSRLLFRGYGSTKSMRPIDAAMAGTDSLVILDEAHLAPHLMDLLPALSECTPGALPILADARSRPTIVALTATGDTSEADRFDLDAEDEAHPIVRQRLDAAKPVEVRVGSGDAGQRLAEAARFLMERTSVPAGCVVFANTPATARAAFRCLRHAIAEDTAEVLLLTGRVREREAERTRRLILDPVHGMAATRDCEVARQRHLIVVATQTLEVGADIDAEHLVTEACGVRALTQRLGRLNRLGRFPHASAIYVHLPPPKNKRSGPRDAETWPVYGREPAMMLQRLLAAGKKGSNGRATVNLPPRRVAEILGPPADDPGRAPEILNGLLWEWAKTTTPPEGEAPVEPYFSGIAAPEYLVTLIWRVHVPNDGELLWPRATDREAVEVPLHEVRHVLGDDEELRRLAHDGVTMETAAREDLRPGDVIVLDSERGLLDEFGWDPESSGPVVDASIADSGLPLDAGALRRLCGVSVGGPVNRALGIAADDEDVDEADRAEAVDQILEAIGAATPTGWDESDWRELIADLERRPVDVSNEVARLPRRAAPDPTSDELDELSQADTAVELDRHNDAVAARSRTIAERLGIPSDLIAMVERAGRAHDLGKLDRRFQQWLDPDGIRPVPVAKSEMPRSRWNAARIAAGWPRGGRHEELSARLVRGWLEAHPDRLDPLLAELLVHLIVSHHGAGRPLVMPVDDHTADAVSFQIESVSVDVPADLSIVDWSQPGRFKRLNDRFGPWGLALLEAVVRRADHAVSAGARVNELEVR